MIALLLWGCVRPSPMTVTLPDPTTACAIPAESAQVSIDPPEGPVFQVAISGQPGLQVWLRAGSETGRVILDAPLRLVGESSLVGTVLLSEALERPAVTLPAGSPLSRASYTIGGAVITRRLGGASAPLLVTVHDVPCGALRYAPGEPVTPVREVPPDDRPGRFYVLEGDALLSKEPFGQAVATLSPSRSEAYVRVVTLDAEIAEIEMTFADGARLAGWIPRAPLSRFAVEPPEDVLPGFRDLAPESPLPASSGTEVTLPAGLPIVAAPGAAPWAEVIAPVQATVTPADKRGWLTVTRIAGLEGLAAPDGSPVAWIPARRVD